MSDSEAKSNKENIDTIGDTSTNSPDVISNMNSPAVEIIEEIKQEIVSPEPKMSKK